ncbi:8-oxo-dGTP diphosphatase [Allobranchiibius sp. GilTou73]|uniref:8-oxo-dGTP diphosphatase n=1 Tax=Allobranchiibius sp. GilTou73 TaxID=2904523 RepID=UPI001F168F2F|nr:NUDIX domain-containing protein [Allobranchiibius sp. GilTou73]UIJ36614.1 NUDIX domain-containing protein [Allobranchiibius sp. GilTou73]
MCLMLLRRGGDLLLGEKLTGFGAGRVVAPGGHVEPGESPLAAAVRETHEETGLAVHDATLCARLEFAFPARPAWDLRLEVFTSTTHTGALTPSSELAPWWCPVRGLPLDRMWDDDRYWLARVLGGERLQGRFVYAPDNETVQHADLHPLDPT